MGSGSGQQVTTTGRPSKRPANETPGQPIHSAPYLNVHRPPATAPGLLTAASLRRGKRRLTERMLRRRIIDVPRAAYQAERTRRQPANVPARRPDSLLTASLGERLVARQLARLQAGSEQADPREG